MSRLTIQRYFWNPIYDRLARGYDTVDWLTGFTTQRLRTRALAYLPHPGTRLLEIGFGSGMLHAELASRYQMAGIDLAPGMAGLTRQRLDNSGHHSALCVGSVYAIPWPDATFDAVLSTFAFSAFADADRYTGSHRVFDPDQYAPAHVDTNRRHSQPGTGVGGRWLCGR